MVRGGPRIRTNCWYWSPIKVGSRSCALSGLGLTYCAPCLPKQRVISGRGSSESRTKASRRRGSAVSNPTWRHSFYLHEIITLPDDFTNYLRTINLNHKLGVCLYIKEPASRFFCIKILRHRTWVLNFVEVDPCVWSVPQSHTRTYNEHFFVAILK